MGGKREKERKEGNLREKQNNQKVRFRFSGRLFRETRATKSQLVRKAYKLTKSAVLPFP